MQALRVARRRRHDSTRPLDRAQRAQHGRDAQLVLGETSYFDATALPAVRRPMNDPGMRRVAGSPCPSRETVPTASDMRARWRRTVFSMPHPYGVQILRAWRQKGESGRIHYIVTSDGN